MNNTRSLFVYEELKKRIVIGKLAQRERLSENNISEELGVSRTPVREALKMLEQEGLVSRDSLGVYVTALNKKEIADLYAVRKELEGLAAEQAALNGNEEMFKTLANLVQEMNRLSSDDIIPWIEIHGKFHDHISYMSGNSYLKQVLSYIRTCLGLVRSSSIIAIQRRADSLKEHTDIACAILAKDPQNAKKYAKKHAQMAEDYILNSLIF